MKNKAFHTILIFAILFPFGLVSSQINSEKRDKFSLLTVPFNKQPLTLYKGQLQVNAGYEYAIRKRSFDEDWNTINLKENGNASVLHYSFLDLKYGLLDFLELGASTSYSLNGTRGESMIYMSTGYTYILNSLDEHKGMGDLYVYSALRLPFKFTWYDVRLAGGIYLPVAPHKPDRPAHEISYDALSNVYSIKYHFNNNNGYGVPVYQISAAAKFSFNKFSFYTDYIFRNPLKDGTNIRWDETLLNNIFYYTSQTYSYLLDREMMFSAAFFYQAAGWFNMHVNVKYTMTSDGWTEYWPDLIFQNPEKNLLQIEPGFEIQISPSLRIYQIAGITMAGKNTEAPFYMITTVSYNIFPFLK